MPSRDTLRGTAGTGPSAPTSLRDLRTLLSVTERAIEGMRVIPGKSWGLHYPHAGKRDAALAALYSGEDTAVPPGALVPDAVMFDVQELLSPGGATRVPALLRDLSLRLTPKAAEHTTRFLTRVRTEQLPLDDALQLGDAALATRARIEGFRILGATGQQQLRTAVEEDVAATCARLQQNEQPTASSLLDLFRIHALVDQRRAKVDPALLRKLDERAAASDLSVQTLRTAFDTYAMAGSDAALDALADAVRAFVQQPPPPPPPPGDVPGGDPGGQPGEGDDEQEGGDEGEPGGGGPGGTPGGGGGPGGTPGGDGGGGVPPEDQQLIDDFKDRDLDLPGGEKDPGIPPEDQDEYHTPPEGRESLKKSGAIFEIRPVDAGDVPLTGYYCTGRKSYFDPARNVWSKRKQLRGLQVRVAPSDRQTIGGTLTAGTKALPIPSGYAPDPATLRVEGARATIQRDQNGCFYLQVDGRGTFTVEFGREEQPLVSPIVPEDTQVLSHATLRAETERAIAALRGSPADIARQVVSHILGAHVYPGGGDLRAAQGLQAKLRRERQGAAYLPALDASKELECYSANTLAVAMMRRAGVPTRLVTGHRVQGASKGCAAITGSTGHAWFEFFDGARWVRADATPAPDPDVEKPDDAPNDEQQDGTPSKEANDGGQEQPPNPQPPKKPKKPEKQKKQSKESKQGGDPGGEQGGEGQEGQGQGQGEGQEGQSQDGGGDQSGEGQSSPSSGQSSPSSQSSRQGGAGGALAGGRLPEISDEEIAAADRLLEEAASDLATIERTNSALATEITMAKTAEDLRDAAKELAKADLPDDARAALEQRLKDQVAAAQEQVRSELQKAVDDGFMSEEQRDKILKELAAGGADALERAEREMAQERALHEQYLRIRTSVMPEVERWYQYVADRLPKERRVELNEEDLTRKGRLDARAAIRPSNLLAGTVMHPQEIQEERKPRFLASILVDVSGSMQGQNIEFAQRLLVFYCELFERIRQEYGYFRFSIDVFSDGLAQVKGFDMDFDTPLRHVFPDGARETVKARIMHAVRPTGGTNMLPAIQHAAAQLQAEIAQLPGYFSALYFIGDGGDGHGNQANIRRFIELNNAEHGFGEHALTATLLGDASQRQVLAEIFGEERTQVAPTFDALLEQSMEKFERDVEEFARVNDLEI